jgi:hypothetical protein
MGTPVPELGELALGSAISPVRSKQLCETDLARDGCGLLIEGSPRRDLHRLQPRLRRVGRIARRPMYSSQSNMAGFEATSRTNLGQRSTSRGASAPTFPGNAGIRASGRSCNGNMSEYRPNDTRKGPEKHIFRYLVEYSVLHSSFKSHSGNVVRIPHTPGIHGIAISPVRQTVNPVRGV